MRKEKEKVMFEKVAIKPDIEWANAVTGLLELQAFLSSEIASLQKSEAIKNAYSPVTWYKLCHYIKHATEGMVAVRLAVEGRTTKEIHAMTGIKTRRVGAFRAWNTMYGKAIRKWVTIKWRKEQERQADIAFLRSIGIAVEDENAATEVTE